MKKPCAGCGKQIPQAALHCVFCNTKQESGDATSSGDGWQLGDSAPDVPPSETQAPTPAPQAAPIHSSKAGVTLIGLRTEDVQAAIAAEAAARAAAAADPMGGAPIAPMPLDLTPVRGLPVVPDPGSVAPTADADGALPYGPLVRLVMASGGLVLIALFFMPWRGTSSWQLLETLPGTDFVRQLYYLAGGAILFATAVLPVPLAFRATIGTLVASLPLILGAEGFLSGWRGLVGALAVIALTATHLVRTRKGAVVDRRARALVVAAAVFVALIYLVPVASVVPLVYVGTLLGSMSVGGTIVGLFIAIPLVLAGLSLLGALGRDLTSVAVLLSVLILLWAPAAALIFLGDGTQLYIALALLWTSIVAALSLAQLLVLAAARAPRRA